MGPDQPPTPPNNPLYQPQRANTDQQPFQARRSDERLLDPPAAPLGTSMFMGMSQGSSLLDLPNQSYMPHLLNGHFPSGNWAAASFNTSDIPTTHMNYDQLTPAAPMQQFHHGDTSHLPGTLGYPYARQPPTLDPYLATNGPLPNRQPSNSPLQSSLRPHSQSQERAESGPPGASLRMNPSFGPPPETATTSLHGEHVDESAMQVANPPTSTVRGIELQSPRPPEGETTVRLRRDTCIHLNFDMRSLSGRTATYDGLKIPSTPSVRKHGSESGKNLLHLQIRVLGATTKAPYDTLCHDCKNRDGDKGAFPDFHAKSNVLVPRKNGKVPVALTLACCSKHRENDSGYHLEVILNRGPEQGNPFIRYELPYSFNIVPKLPPRPRNLAEDVDAAVPPPLKVPRIVSDRTSCVRNSVSQSAGPSGQGELSSGDSRGPTNSMSSGTSEPPVPPADIHHLPSPAEAPMPYRQSRQTLNAASDEENTDGRDAVVERTNPVRGPTTGGPEVWISGSSFPTGLTPLYARFGDNPARAVVQKPDLLSCRLPQADVPGIVTVTLSRSHDPNAPVLGTSLCQFEYFTDLSEMLPVIIRIKEDCTPEFAAALDVLHREMKLNSERNGKRPLRGEARDDNIETAIIQALASLQNTPDFEKLISKTNDYNQTLAHFAVLFGYINLLKRLVGWNIDLAIADVNGFTALHCAYKQGDRGCVELLLEKGASKTVLDALGRAPSHLTPAGFDLNDYDTEMASDNQSDLEPGFSVPFKSTDSGHVVSDSNDEKSVNNECPCQGRSDQKDICYPVTSTSKAAVGDSSSRPWGLLIPKIRQIPDVPNNADVNSVVPELRERLVDPEAIEYLCKEVFPTGEISLPALRAPMCEPEGAESGGATERYHGLLLKIGNNSYKCRLCPRDDELHFDDDEEALHHITKSHLNMGYGCIDRGGKRSWNTTFVDVNTRLSDAMHRPSLARSQLPLQQLPTQQFTQHQGPLGVASGTQSRVHPPGHENQALMQYTSPHYSAHPVQQYPANAHPITVRPPFQSHHHGRPASGVHTNFGYTLSIPPGPQYDTPVRVPVPRSNNSLAQWLGDSHGGAPVNPTEVLTPEYHPAPRSPHPAISSTEPKDTILTVLEPKFANGRFIYRERVTVQVEWVLGWTMPSHFGGVVLGPASVDASQLMLVCYAACSSCTSQALRPIKQCNPNGFYLDPVPPKRNQGLELDKSSGTLTGNVTFKIRSRKRRPRPGDKEWRCPSESLILTYSLCDYVGNAIARRQVEAPFQMRRHTRKDGPQCKPLLSESVAPPQHAGGFAPVPHLQGAYGTPLVPFASGTQTAPPILPAAYAAPAYAQDLDC